MKEEVFVVIDQRKRGCVVGILFSLFLTVSPTLTAKEIGMRNLGTAQLIGSVISTPCSIVMPNRDQTVVFLPTTLTMLSSALEREQHTQPFEIELRDCGSAYTAIDTKTWTIRFDGYNANNINAFVLEGPSQGLGVSLLDNDMKTLRLGENYSLFESLLRHDEAGPALFLRYFLRLEPTGKPLQAGNYQGLVRFFIDYQ
ncbi:MULTISPECIES: fimbrial protein [unclassified Acinetobacter]|uniref:fimbrial protein n=1 Tax=unclassified Acinetobacter TaxID=196816 RepID=UPI00190A5180|nr:MULTISPECIES: fimbrial protein [unclassified Acinetobacter]